MGLVSTGHVANAACTICITSPEMQLVNQDVNDLGAAPGEFLRFGADSVALPDGTSTGITGTATTVNTVTGQLVTYTSNFDGSPDLPNYFLHTYAYNPNLLGPHTLTYTNGTATASTIVSLPSTATFLPFINSVTLSVNPNSTPLSGNVAAPTFSWTAPISGTVDGYRIDIIDKSLVSLTNVGQVASATLYGPLSTSYTVRQADFATQGYTFNPQGQYEIAIVALQTSNGSTTNLSNSNVDSRSVVYADWSPLSNGAPSVNLPVAIVNGQYEFNLTVVPGQTYYIDPTVATGYEYAIGAGDPNFASVTMPTGIGGAFQLWEMNSLGNLVLVTDLVGGQTYDFAAGGLSFFEITGIDPADGLDPSDTTAFITGLTFTGAGTFDGTQTPITTDVAAVPEPMSVALLCAGLGGLVVFRKNWGKSAGTTS